MPTPRPRPASRSKSTTGSPAFRPILIGGPATASRCKSWTARCASARRARRAAISAPSAALADAEGFVDTGDMVELRGDRYYFVGRRGGIINVGGLKVHPEEDRGGDQPAPARCGCRWCGAKQARSPARSSSPTWS